LKKTALAVAALSGFASVSLVHAQGAATPPPPPKVLQIFREVLKPGHAAPHVATEAGWPAAFRKANWPNHYIAVSSVTGPSEAWFLSPWDSFAAYEKDGQDIEANAALQAEMDRLSALDRDHLSDSASILATYREDLSYRPMIDVPRMRYFQVVTFRVKPGRAREWVAARKMIQNVHEKANMDEQWVTYEIVSGMPGGTFLMFLPLKSMADLDAVQQMHGAAYQAATGEDDGRRISDLTNASLDSSTSVIMRVSPKMSYPPKEFATIDTFWAPAAPKPAAKATAVKKTTN
jgi:hypothetical protein